MLPSYSSQCSAVLQIEEGKLKEKDFDVLVEACKDLVKQCEDKILETKNQLAEMARNGEPISSAARQKAILINFRGISGINAETTTTRWHNLRFLHQHVQKSTTFQEDIGAWRIPNDSLKATPHWHVEWTQVDDAHLLAGVYKHGFASWEAIQAVSSADHRSELSSRLNSHTPSRTRSSI